MIKINDYVTYNKDKSVTLTAKQLDVYIPMSYQSYKMLKISNTITTLGIFDMSVNEGKETGMLFLPAVIEMSPTEIKEETYNGNNCLHLTFMKGDTFIRTTQVVRNEYIAYIVFTEYLEKGNIPQSLAYNDLAFIFDTIIDVTKSKIRADHSVFEILYSHLTRDKSNVSIPYRLTPMTKDPVHIKLKDVPHASMSVTAKLIGSYLNDSINSALINEADNESDIENLLRQ